MNFYTFILVCAIISSTSAHQSGETKFFKATPFITSKNSQFGPFIEGASVNKAGEAFASNFGGNFFKIGRIAPGQALYHASSRTTTYFNGIRFLPLSKDDVDAGIKNIALVANPKEGEVTKITEMNDGTTKQETFCKDESFINPNDLAISKTGRVYISGENLTDDVGGLWLCQPDGTAMQLKALRKTNGIELSPDEKFLYLTESINGDNFVTLSNIIWKYKIDPTTGLTSSRELFVDFKELDGTQSLEIDGIRTDIEGNLYVTRYGGQEVVIISPDKKLLGRIQLSIKNPTNLEFAGEEGKTLFIVGVCYDDMTKGCVDKFENTIPGNAFTVLNS